MGTRSLPSNGASDGPAAFTYRCINSRSVTSLPAMTYAASGFVPPILSTPTLKIWRCSVCRPETWGAPDRRRASPPPPAAGRAAKCLLRRGGGSTRRGVGWSERSRRRGFRVASAGEQLRARRGLRPSGTVEASAVRGVGIRPEHGKRSASMCRHAREAGRLVPPGRGLRAIEALACRDPARGPGCRA